MIASSCGPSPSPDSFFSGLPSLSHIPLSAVLSAAGFRMASMFADIASPLPAGIPDGGDASTASDMPASSGPSSATPPPAPPVPAQPSSTAASAGSILGLSPFSVQGFVGDDAAKLLEEALASPLSSQLSAARKSPRFHTGFTPRYS